MSIATTARRNLMIIAVAYSKATGLTLGQISKRAYGNASFLEQFRDGEVSISLKKLDDLLTWFSSNWPENADSPFLRPLFMTVGK